MAKAFCITETKLRKLYLEQRFSIRKIAEIERCSPTTIRKRLKTFGINTRNREDNYRDLYGQKFGRLMVVVDKPKSWKNRKVWTCKCECGNMIEVKSDSLVCGNTMSCGCIQKEYIGSNNPNWKGYQEIPKSYLSSIKHGAKSRNLKFEIKIEELWKLYIKQGRKCAISGLELEFVFGEKFRDNDKHPSLDRIDSSVGYQIDNVQWVHKDINKMKQNLDQDYFIQMCKTVSDNIG